MEHITHCIHDRSGSMLAASYSDGDVVLLDCLQAVRYGIEVRKTLASTPVGRLIQLLARDKGRLAGAVSSRDSTLSRTSQQHDS
jgi:hypothetical protein